VKDPQIALRQLTAAAAGLAAGHDRASPTQNGNYVHATAESRLLGFVNDFEFLALPEEEVIQACSESRLGVSALVVNAWRCLSLEPAATPAISG